MYKKFIYLFFLLFLISPSFLNAEPSTAPIEVSDTNLNDQAILKLFKSEYATLKKVQLEQLRQQKEQQAGKFYDQGILFYRQKQYSQAKEFFEKADAVISDFKGSKTYLKRIQEKVEQQQEQEAIEKQKFFEQQKKQEAIEKQKKIEQQQKEEMLQKQRDLEEKRREDLLQERKKSEGKNQQQEAIKPQKSHQKQKLSKQSKLEVQQKIKNGSKHELKEVSLPILTLEEQAQEARILAELAERSLRLYRDVADSTEDKNINLAKKKLANLQGALNNLKDEKNKNLISIRAEEQRRIQQEQKEKEQFHRNQVQQVYDEAIQLLREQNFDEAKKKFQEVDNIYPDFKSTRSYLNQIDEDKRKVQQQALAEKTRQEEKMAQEEILRKRAQEEQARKEKQAQDQEQSLQLTQKVVSLNDEILRLTKNKDYMSAKAKLEELEQVVSQLKVVRESLARTKEDEDLAKMQAKKFQQEEEQKQKLIREKNTHESHQVVHAKESRQQAALDVKQKELFKQKEERQRQEEVFRQGVELFRARKYTAAKVIFAELVSKGDSRARSYLRKTDQLIHKNVTEAYVFENRQRSDFLNEKRRQQKISNIRISQERERQIRLTQELEKQRKVFERQRQQEQRRIQVLKMEEKEWQRLEAKRQQMESKVQKQKEEYHFRKIKPASQNSVELAKENPKDSKEGFVKIKPIPDQKEQNVKYDSQNLGFKNNDDQEKLEESKQKIANEEINQKNQFQKRLEEVKEQKGEARKRKEEERQKRIQEQKQKKEQELKNVEEVRKKKEEERQKRIQEQKEKKEKEFKNLEDVRKKKEGEVQKKLQEDKEEKEKSIENLADLRKKKEEERQKKIQEQKQKKEQELKNIEEVRTKQLEEANKQKEEARRRQEEDRQKRIQEQQEEKERVRKQAEDLRKQREESRQKEIERRRQEAEEQEKERLEKQKRNQQLLLEQKQREQLEKTAQEYQQRLEEERKAIRQQLENGVQSIYEEALRLYKSGRYQAAAQRFSDVKDLIPNYKNTEELLEKSHEHVNDQQILPLVPSKVSAPQSTTEPPQKDDISKTLDLFENL